MKYRVTRQVIYQQTIEVEADSNEEAIEIAQATPVDEVEKVFLDTDYYEAEPIKE